MYTRGQAIDFIEKVFGSGIPSNQGLNLSVVCPVCQSKKSFTARSSTKKKLVIRTDNFLCHCWVCGYRSRNLVELIKQHHSEWLPAYLSTFIGSKLIRATSYEANEHGVNEPEKLALPPGFKTLNEFVAHFPLMAFENIKDPAAPNNLIFRYVYERFDKNIIETTDACTYWGFGFVEGDRGLENRVIIPSFDAEGQLNYYSARAITDTAFPKYQNPSVPREDIVFNELNIDWSDPLTIVEGPFDLVKCNSNATCLLGSNLTTEYLLFLRLIQHNTPVILALDPDAEDKTLRIAELLHNYGNEVKILTIPSCYKDVGEMTRKDFIKQLEHAKLFDKGYSLRSRIAGLVGTK